MSGLVLFTTEATGNTEAKSHGANDYWKTTIGETTVGEPEQKVSAVCSYREAALRVKRKT